MRDSPENMNFFVFCLSDNYQYRFWTAGTEMVQIGPHLANHYGTVAFTQRRTNT